MATATKRLPAAATSGNRCALTKDNAGDFLIADVGGTRHNRAMGAGDPTMKDGDAVHPEAAVAPGYLANHAARVFNRNVDTALRQHGLSLGLLAPVLLLLWKGPMRQRDLVAASAVKQPAMVALLGKLESMGLIARTPAPDDGRAAIVTLTQAGARMAEVGGEILRCENARGLAGFSTEEAATLVTLLGRFISGLDQEQKHHR